MHPKQTIQKHTPSKKNKKHCLVDQSRSLKHVAICPKDILTNTTCLGSENLGDGPEDEKELKIAEEIIRDPCLLNSLKAPKAPFSKPIRPPKTGPRKHFSRERLSEGFFKKKEV